jgi:hypothetical protein
MLTAALADYIRVNPDLFIGPHGSLLELPVTAASSVNFGRL